jgi:hypothetical protein
MISKELATILHDFIKDMLGTFPEYKDKLHPGLLALYSGHENAETEIMAVIDHCKQVYPERFFDILYQKEDIFSESIYFLPGIDFKEIWSSDITPKTRTIIWKYLQLLLFSIVSAQKGTESFGDTAKLFEAIDEEEFSKKLEETMDQMSSIFNISGEAMDASSMPIPDPAELQNHISSLLDGDLGKLAREIAEETANEMNSDIGDATSVGDVFKKLFRNPGKLMGMVQKVGTKLDSKLKSGEMKESDLIKQASDLITKMNKMPAMKQMNTMLGSLGLPVGNGKINMNAFQAHMERNLQSAKTRERMQEKLQRRREEQQMKAAMQAAMQTAVPAVPAVPAIPPTKKKRRRRRKKKGKNKK